LVTPLSSHSLVCIHCRRFCVFPTMCLCRNTPPGCFYFMVGGFYLVYYVKISSTITLITFTLLVSYQRFLDSF
jgi:hypothetical protein